MCVATPGNSSKRACKPAGQKPLGSNLDQILDRIRAFQFGFALGVMINVDSEREHGELGDSWMRANRCCSERGGCFRIGTFESVYSSPVPSRRFDGT